MAQELNLETRFARNGRTLLYNGRGLAENDTIRLAGPPSDLIEDAIAGQNTYDYSGLNFTRYWMFEYYTYCDNPQAASPFLREGNQWDITQPNEAYYTDLRSFIETMRDEGIVVMISLFEGVGLDYKSMGDGPCRWPTNPWNSINNINRAIVAPNEEFDQGMKIGNGGFPKFYDPTILVFEPSRHPVTGQIIVDSDGVVQGKDITLSEVQDRYVTQVIEQTREYWNVCYEIMNEPQKFPNGTTMAEYVTFCDRIAGLVHDLTDGQRLIYYNALPDGRDLNHWKTNAHAHYDKVHGVIFHGVNPHALTPEMRDGTFFPPLDPNDPNSPGDDAVTTINQCNGNLVVEAGSGADFLFEFRDEKLFQVSTDAFRLKINGSTLWRDSVACNAAWATHVLGEKMSLEAFTFNTDALDDVVAAGLTDLTTIPDAPQNFRITAEDKPAHKVSLAWDAVAGADGYRIYRAETEDALHSADSFDELPGPGNTSYTIEDEIGWKGFVAVRAYHTAGNNSLLSNVLDVETSYAYDAVLVEDEFLDLDVGLGVERPDRRFTGRVTFRNIGWATWTPEETINENNHKRGLYVRCFGVLHGASLFDLMCLSASVPPGETATLDLDVLLPYSRDVLTIEIGMGRLTTFSDSGQAWGHFGQVYTELPDGTPIQVRVTNPARRGEPRSAGVVLVAPGVEVDTPALWSTPAHAYQFISLQTTETAPEGTVIYGSLHQQDDGQLYVRCRYELPEGYDGEDPQLAVGVSAMALHWSDRVYEKRRLETISLGTDGQVRIELEELKNRFFIASVRSTPATNLNWRTFLFFRGQRFFEMNNTGPNNTSVDMRLYEVAENLPDGVPEPRLISGTVTIAQDAPSYRDLGAPLLMLNDTTVVDPGDAVEHHYVVPRYSNSGGGTIFGEVVLRTDASGQFRRSLELTGLGSGAYDVLYVPFISLDNTPVECDHDARILHFFNTVKSAAAIVARVGDDPEAGPASPRAYGIRPSLAQRIIEDRDARESGTFSSIDQIDAIAGIGPDTLRDLYHAFEQGTSSRQAKKTRLPAAQPAI